MRSRAGHCGRAAYATHSKHCLFIRLVIEMPKYTFLFVIMALAVCVQGLPAYQDDVADAAAAGDWDRVHAILEKSFQQFGIKPVGVGDVRSLKPQGGGHVYAESDVNFKTSSNVNGQLSQRSGGHHVINTDGKVSEFDYKP